LTILKNLETCVWKELIDPNNAPLGKLKCINCNGRGNYKIAGEEKPNCLEFLTYNASIYLSNHSKYKEYYQRICEDIEKIRGLR
jgi:hypothetical protein